MDEALKAFSSPTWWVLTVVVGLLLNVVAPFINKGIDSLWASRSSKKRRELERVEAEIQARVDKLATKPNGLVEAKLEVIYWGVRILVTLCIYLLVVQVSFSTPVTFMALSAAPIALVAFLTIARDWKRWNTSHRVHNRLLDILATAESKPE